MKTQAIDTASIEQLPEEGVCSLCCYEHTCGLVDTEPCCASVRKDGRDVYFIEIEE
ncbi:hypothetical protein RUK48_003106 [Vibrio cholerae]|nr:hypothetical protein [Vibrio cholerae]